MPELSTIWFALVALLFAMWAVMDGFDLGVGVLHRFVARTDEERRLVFASIGPVWDGNEVWLLAAGGSMFLAFPKLLAAGFSGFYLPVIFVVWALIVRGISIELRSHLESPLWRSFFDTTFMLGSAVVPVLLGAALGKIIEGVPLRPDGFFELDLFPEAGHAGVVDGYTALVGLFVLLTLTAHGANWLRWKTTGPVHERASVVRRWAWPAVGATWLVVTLVTTRVAPEVTAVFGERPFAWLGVVLVLGGLIANFVRRDDERLHFFGGAAFIAGALVSTVACLFPTVLRATDSSLSLTTTSAASAGVSMSAGLWWWGPGVLLAAGYLWWVLRHFQGKARVTSHDTAADH
ncbi:MAG: cytochrome d ubiquinol oxidase subunit II [Myxococcaceae bacterium]